MFFLDVRFNAYPEKYGGDMTCQGSTPPKTGEGCYWIDPITSRLSLWRIERIELYQKRGVPMESIPESSKAEGYIWLDKVGEFEAEADIPATALLSTQSLEQPQ